ncbi:MAG: ADP-ribosylglycohydrolase family protein [Planctomycetes bacterium]|nr:ADP-ribosylglycohydrolase family protein [Planctomycetota bacterium]
MEDRIIGMALGLAAGDALGGPVEFMSKQQILIKHGVVRDPLGGGWLGLRPGQWTDETEMMLFLMESIVEKGTFDSQDVARRYLAWFRASPIAIGNSVRAALALLDGGTPLADASRLAHEGAGGASDNGALGRGAPLAALLWNDPGALLLASRDEARITHWDPVAESGSALLHLILARILAGAASKADAIREADAILADNDLDLYNPLTDVTGRPETSLATTSTVNDTLETAIWCFLYRESVEDALVTAVNLGGDTDSIAAVAGALCGAWYGEAAIPDRWLRTLQDRNRIRMRARKLAQIAPKAPGA